MESGVWRYQTYFTLKYTYYEWVDKYSKLIMTHWCVMTNNITKSFCIKSDEYTNFSLKYFRFWAQRWITNMCDLENNKMFLCPKIHETLWYSASIVCSVKNCYLFHNS